jgi:serine/threonine-protein kinase
MNVRLGADGDIEEWLATDEHLGRPVLIRFPGPDADMKRIAEFLAPVRAAAATTHPHVQRIYAAGEVDGSAFAVAEWDGAVTIADRLKAGETLPIAEYLTNASGLAAGLAAFHANGGIHGAIDPRAIHFSAAHPARLASFGRIPLTTTRAADTSALAAALRTAITGSDNPAILPSHVAEGIPSSVDTALGAAEAGTIDAKGLADALSASSLHPQPDTDRPWSL